MRRPEKVSENLNSKGLEKKSSSGNYVNILQGKGTNAISKISSKTLSYDSKADSSFGEYNGVKLKLQNSSELKWNVQTDKLLRFAVMKLTKKIPFKAKKEEIDNSRTVILNINEFMAVCGLKDKKEARKCIRTALRALYNASVEWEEIKYNGRKKIKKTYRLRILDFTGEDWHGGYSKRGEIIIRFTYEIVEYLCNSYVMSYHINLFRINPRKYPHSYYLGIKFLEHYNQNQNKTNANIISVEKLKEALPEMKKYEDTQKVSEKIIDPFERNMDALVNEYHILNSWEYCNCKEQPLTDEQLKKMNYREWNGLCVKFNLNDYPKKLKKIAKAKKHPSSLNNSLPKCASEKLPFSRVE